MIELYVYMEDNKPKEVIIGRRHAVDRLLADGFKTTPAERRSISVFLEAGPCDLGSGLTLVGWRLEGPDRVADRSITRVIGPGSEV